MPSAPLQSLPCGDSLALFRRLFSHSGDAALLTRPSGEFLAANAAACMVFGASEAELLERSRQGGHWTFADATDPRLAAALAARARNGSARAEARLRRMSGELFDAEMSSVLFLDEGAEPTSLLTVRDISAQRNAERTLRIHEERLEFALDAAAIGDWETNLRSNVTRHSLRHDQCFGYAEAVAPWDYDIFLTHVHPEDRERVDAGFRSAMSGSEEYDAEFRVLWGDGSVHWLWNKGRFYFDEAGEPLRVAGIVTDISARKRAAAAQDALAEQTRRHERMLTSALSAMQDHAHIYDRDGRFLFVNQPLLELWQTDLAQVIGKNFAEIGYPAELAAHLQAQLREVVATKSSITGETPYTGAAGVPGWYEYIFSPVLGADGAVDFVVGSSRDVTERMRSAQVLAASAAEFRILAESMPQIVWVTRPDGWHIHFNQHWMEYTGLTAEESLGHGWNSPVHPADRERAAVRWRQATESGEPYEIEYRLRRADGLYHWMLGRALPLRDSAGVIVKWFGTCTDIDDLKQAQLDITFVSTALKESEQRYRSLFEQNIDGIYSVDREGRLVTANDAYLRLIGHSAAEALSMEFLHFAAPECVTSSAAWFQRALAGEPVHYESICVHCDGTRIEVDVNYQPLIVDGAIAGVHGIVRDITERKRAAELLHRQQAFLAALVENVADGIVACDAEGCVTLSNRAVRELRAREFEPEASTSRFEPVDLLLADGTTPMPPGQLPWLRALHDGSVRNLEMLLVLPVGAPRRLRASGQALFDAEGRKTGAVVAMRDITAERLAEEAIRTQAHMLDSIGQAVIAADLSGTVTYLNRFAQNLYGWTFEEAIGRSIIDIAAPLATCFHGAEMLAQLRDGTAWHSEFTGRRRDGGEFQAAVTVAVLQDRDGLVTGMIGVSEDVSERKRAEEALRRQHALLLNAQRVAEMGVWEIDLPNNHLVWSEETHRIFGIEPAAFDNTFEAFFALVHPDDAPWMMALYAAPPTASSSLELEYRICRPDGEERVVFERGEIVQDASGRPRRKSGVVMDVTERRREQDALRHLNAGLEARVLARTTELDDANRTLAVEIAERTSMLAALKLSEERFRTLTALSADWFWEQDADLRFVQFTSGATELGGLSVETHVGALRWELPHTEIVGGDWGPHKALVAAHQPFRDLLLARTVPEGTRYVLVSGTPRHASDGSFAGYLGIGRDVTHAKRAELALIEARDAADAASRAKSDFLATMSHEIRTPMNGVIGMLEVLQQAGLNGDQVGMVDVIRQSALALLAIIEDILDFSKIEAGKLQVEREPLQLADLVEQACAMLVPMAARSHVRLTVFVDPAIPVSMVGDAGRLRQVMLNLVGNAIKFSSGRDTAGRVDVRARLVEQQPACASVELSVADNGIGIDALTLARLFQPFAQADVSTTRRYGGTGLGLAISKTLVELMGGRIDVRSQPDQGSTFTLMITLPARAGGAAADDGRSLVRGLQCRLIGSDEPLGADIAAYLVDAGVTVERAPDLAGAGAAGSAAGAWLWLLLPELATANIKTLRALAGGASDTPPRFVAMGHGARRHPRIVARDLVTVDADALSRRTLYATLLLAAHGGPGVIQRPADALAAAPGGPNLRAPLAAQVPHLPSRDAASPQRRAVLVAEDNAVNRAVIERQLRLAGIAAEVCVDGAEALKRWRSGEFALLLTDLHMPGFDGYELAAAIRCEEAPGQRAPIIALTANALRAEQSRCLRSGMDACLTKPVPLTLLKETLDAWLDPAQADALRSASAAQVPAT